MAKAERPYKVYTVEQHGRQLWSEHARLDLALAAAKRYRRRNPDADHWVDHYGYVVVGPDGKEHNVR